MGLLWLQESGQVLDGALMFMEATVFGPHGPFVVKESLIGGANGVSEEGGDIFLWRVLAKD